MGNLIKAELFKLRKSTAYKALFLIYCIIEIIVTMNNISNSIIYPKYNPAYTGAEWLSDPHPTLYVFVILLLTAFYVNGDFTNHTFYSGLLCGIPREKAFFAKVISLFAGTLPLMFTYLLTGTVLWSVHSGFGMDFGIKVVFLIIKSIAGQILISLMLVSNSVFFAVIAKSQIGTFGWSFSILYLFGVLRANIENIIQIEALSKILSFLLSLFYLNFGTLLASILLKLLLSGYIFGKMDLK